MDSILDALNFATAAHSGQVDKLGVPYIEHPKTVAQILTISPAFHMLNSVQKITALESAYLHDVVEDTDFSLNDLRFHGFDEETVLTVERLTFIKNTTRESYYENILLDPVARSVKVSDLIHNNYHSRIIMLPKEQQERLAAKYAIAKRMLLKESEYDFFFRATR